MKVRAEQLRIGDRLHLRSFFPHRTKIITWLELDNDRKVVTIHCEGLEPPINPLSGKIKLAERDIMTREFDDMVELMEKPVEPKPPTTEQIIKNERERVMAIVEMIGYHYWSEAKTDPPHVNMAYLKLLVEDPEGEGRRYAVFQGHEQKLLDIQLKSKYYR